MGSMMRWACQNTHASFESCPQAPLKPVTATAERLGANDRDVAGVK